MTAQEIHKISIVSAEEFFKPLLQDIYEYIGSEAQKGKFSCCVSTQPYHDKQGSHYLDMQELEVVFETLKSKGFMVRYLRFGDMPQPSMKETDGALILAKTKNFIATPKTKEWMPLHFVYCSISWYARS